MPNYLTSDPKTVVTRTLRFIYVNANAYSVKPAEGHFVIGTLTRENHVWVARKNNSVKVSHDQYRHDLMERLTPNSFNI